MTTHHTDEKKPTVVGLGAASCALAVDENGRFYMEAVTSDGEEALRKMLRAGVAVTVTSVPSSALITGSA